MRSTESLVEKEEPEFKVDLRIKGIAQDVIPEDDQRMGQLQKVVDKLRNGYHTKSIVEDLEKPGNPSSSAKSRVVQFTNLAMLKCTCWDRYPEPSSANLA